MKNAVTQVTKNPAKARYDVAVALVIKSLPDVGTFYQGYVATAGVAKEDQFQNTVKGEYDENLITLSSLRAVLAHIPSADVRLLITVNRPYVVTGITENAENWIRRNWMTTKGHPVQHAEKWQELIAVLAEFKSVTWCCCTGNQTGFPLMDNAIQSVHRMMVMETA